MAAGLLLIIWSTLPETPAFRLCWYAVVVVNAWGGVMGFADDEEDILLEFLDVSTVLVSPMVNTTVLSYGAKTSVSGILAVTFTMAF